MTPLEALPRRGFVAAPTPVEEARGLDLDWLGIKRDDRIEALAGGSKVRKLDVLLASSPWRDAPRWAGAGAIGSGQLVALSMAARATGRPLDAHVFWTPPDPWVLDNLAATASNAATVRYYPDRVALAVKAPAAVGLPIGSVPFVAPGASDPFGNAGMALAGLELAEQIAARQLPTPRRIYVPLGSGGTAVGLSYGLGRAGIRCEIHAVAVVEWVLSLRARLDAMVRALAARHGSVSPAPIVIRRTQLGRGYGFATDAGRDAVARLAGHGLRAEGNYGGKAFAQLVADAHAGWRGATLFWHTARGPLPPPAPDWADRLPAALRRRLEGAGPSRRWVLAAAAAAAVAAGARFAATPSPPFEGDVLGGREAAILRAVAEAVLPDGADPARVAANVDRYLVGLPPSSQVEIAALLLAIEHATGLARFEAREKAERAAALARLDAAGGLFRVMARGVRDLVLLGHWQEDTTWADIGYPGPMVSRERRATAYDALVAPAGTRPRSAS